MQPFGHNTPMSQTNRIDGTAQDNGAMGYGKLFYKWSPKKSELTEYSLTLTKV